MREVQDLNQGQERAVDLTPSDDPDLPPRLDGLGISLGSRYEGTADMADLDQAITHQRYAVDLMQGDSPNLPSFVSNLANSLQIRYKRKGETMDLDQTIAYN
jgi:hypothetical protein